MLIPLAMGIPGLIGGIMDAVSAGKRLQRGGRLRRRRVVRRKYGGKIKRQVHRKANRKYGRGIAADIASALPLIGPLAGPLVRALGGRIHRRAKHYRKLRRGRGMGYSGYVKPKMLSLMGSGLPHTHIYQPIAVGSGLLGPGRYRPAVYGGLLSPTGGAVVHRKGHYRMAKGRRIYVRPALIHQRKKRYLF